MQLPLTDPDTLFEELLQDLPPETAQMAREFKAFVRAKKVKTPGQLLRVVFLYCRWREIRACNDKACGASKSQNSHASLLDLTVLIAASDPKAPFY